MQPTFFKRAFDFERWLAKHHRKERLLVGFDTVERGTAHAYFQAMPPGRKRLYTFWIASAKREATRAKRLAVVLERCRSGEPIDPFHPFSRD